jgi:zinc D-Ala-D-Ala dipeptidase
MGKPNYILLICLFSGILLQCTSELMDENADPSPNISMDTIEIDSIAPIQKTIIKKSSCLLDAYLINEGLINIQRLDSSILVDLKYSTTDNFMKKNMYGCLTNCYLQPDIADRLKLCQEYLKKKDSTLTLLIYDGVRPRSVQQYMWDLLDMPINEKTKFVSNPKKGSLHNFGAAVDITLANALSEEALDMGTDFDYFGILAWPIKEKQMLKDSLLTKQQVDNRKLLRSSMRAGRFFNIQTEWWHFNACYRDSAYIKYKIIEGLPSKDSIKLEKGNQYQLPE